jgi:hypothetical protein
MNKPANYETVKPRGLIGKPRKGFYVFKILNAEEKMTKAAEGKPSRPMLVLHLDIAEGPYAGYFMDKWKKDSKYNPDKAFYRAIHRQITEDTERLKTDITSIEKSNGFTWDWDEASLIGKIVGGAIGEYEYFSKASQSIQTDIEYRYLLPVSQVRSGELDPPLIRKLKKGDTSFDFGDNDPGNFSGDPGPSDENLPF